MGRQLLGMLAVALAAGCGGAKAEVKTESSAGGVQVLGDISKGSRCDAKNRRESFVDLNHDDKADVRKVYAKTPEGEVLVCREADLNFDGVKDIFYYFDETGQPTQDECDLDFDGKIDIVSTYIKGKVVKQELDTNGDGKIDRVRYLDKDLPVRLEGDTDGDGKVDYWEYYEGGKLVRIGQDLDGDGRADKWTRDGETESAELSQGKEPAADAGAAPDGAKAASGS
ncbi:MAG: WD40 repeat domain-containing protein [Deltaproteobacteria bacterium]|nr:WD40 repeat domain-containing protein [Deltaproteobacteria bacterium]